MEGAPESNSGCLNCIKKCSWKWAPTGMHAKEIGKGGKDGGLIIVVKMPDNALIEEMQAMLQSVKEHGRY
jgi:hypothetical protein